MSRRKERRQRFERIRETFARDAGLPFGRLLRREYVLGVLADLGHSYRTRAFCPLVVLWGWLSQCLSQDKSLNEVVTRILANRVASGLPPCSANSASYSNARNRFPLEAMTRMAKEIGCTVHAAADDSWHWRGRPIFMADGTGFSMADTAENQLAYPQSKSQRPGVGFPMMRAVALISLGTGAVVDLAFAKEQGKGTGESNLLRSMMDTFNRGDLLLADRYYPTFVTTAMLLERGVDLVSVSHHARIIDFSEGHVLGPKDHIVEWKRPKMNSARMTRERYNDLPDTIQVREFEITIESRTGRKGEKAIVVTTLTDPTIPQKELSDLYWKRWNIETDIRSIKHSLHMDVLRCKTPDMVRKEIWCHMLAWNLLRGVMVETAKRHDAAPAS